MNADQETQQKQTLPTPEEPTKVDMTEETQNQKELYAAEEKTGRTKTLIAAVTHALLSFGLIILFAAITSRSADEKCIGKDDCGAYWFWFFIELPACIISASIISFIATKTIIWRKKGENPDHFGYRSASISINLVISLVLFFSYPFSYPFYLQILSLLSLILL